MRDPSTGLGTILTPGQGNRFDPRFVRWCADNGCFNEGRRGYPGDEPYLAWLETLLPHAATNLFVTAPDVVGDAAATLERAADMIPRIRAAGHRRVALVAQNGLERLAVPWDTFDVLFLGGGPECAPCGYVRPHRATGKHCPRCAAPLAEWKTGPAAGRLAREALTRGKRVHMGRVNSYRRLVRAHEFGCFSADGTYITFGPDVNLPRVLRWLADIRELEKKTAARPTRRRRGAVPARRASS
ncbi:hypothetical protein, partial [Planomonospora algeriensis]